MENQETWRRLAGSGAQGPPGYRPVSGYPGLPDLLTQTSTVFKKKAFGSENMQFHFVFVFVAPILPIVERHLDVYS